MTLHFWTRQRSLKDVEDENKWLWGGYGSKSEEKQLKG